MYAVNSVVPVTIPGCDTRAIANSGCTRHLLGPHIPCTNKRRTKYGITVGLPNDYQIHSTHPALMPFMQLHISSRQSGVLPDLHNWYLLSIGQSCDHGFQVH